MNITLQELKNYPIWCLRGAPGPNMSEKVPISAITLRPARAGKTADFSATYEQAAAVLEKNRHNNKGITLKGLGVKLGLIPGTDLVLCGLDLDGQKGPSGKKIDSFAARELLETFPTLIEVSCSGAGLHVFFVLTLEELICLPQTAPRTVKEGCPALEFYKEGRYFATTLTAWPSGAPLEDSAIIRPCLDTLTVYLAANFKKEQNPAPVGLPFPYDLGAPLGLLPGQVAENEKAAAAVVVKKSPGETSYLLGSGSNLGFSLTKKRLENEEGWEDWPPLSAAAAKVIAEGANRVISRGPKNGPASSARNLPNVSAARADGADKGTQIEERANISDVSGFGENDERPDRAELCAAGLAYLSAEKAISRARKAKNREKFNALFDCSPEGEEEKASGLDSSALDMSLLSILALYTWRRPGELEKAFLQSSRGKRDKITRRADYLTRSIEYACLLKEEDFENGKITCPASSASPAPNVSSARAAEGTGTDDEKKEEGPQIIEGRSGSMIVDFLAWLNTENIKIKYEVVSRTTEFFQDDYRDPRAPEHLLTLLTSNYNVTARPRVSANTMADYINFISQTEGAYNAFLELVAGIAWNGENEFAKLCVVLRIDGADKVQKALREGLFCWLCQILCAQHNGEDSSLFPIDITLILTGAQGIGKSSLLAKLSLNERKFFGRGLDLNPCDKDSRLAATSYIITEGGEAATFLRRNNDNIKTFLSASFDDVRPPYGRLSVKYPRRTSFALTLNQSEFFTDETGSRRYVVLPLGDDKLNLGGFSAHNLWAQISRYVEERRAAGENYSSIFRITAETSAILQELNTGFNSEVPLEQEVLELLEKIATPSPLLTSVQNSLGEYDITIGQLQRLAGDNLQKVSATKLGRALLAAGFVGRRKGKTKLKHYTLRMTRHNYEEALELPLSDR